MTQKFLPGPWFVSRDERPGMEWNNHIASVEHPHLEVCSMFHTKDDDGNERGEANARLVAAAPDLFSLVCDFENWCDWLDREGHDETSQDRLQEIRSRIAYLLRKVSE